MTNLDDLKKLPPLERIRKLKEIEKNDKEEIEKAQKLIRASEEEAEENKKFEDIPIPTTKKVDITKLFDKQDDHLEQMVENAPIEPSEENKQYLFQLSQDVSAENLYNRMASIYDQGSNLSDEQKQEVQSIGFALEYKAKAMETGSYNPSDEVKQLLTGFISHKYKR